MLLVCEIVEDLRLNKVTVYKLIREGRIPAINLGSKDRPVYRVPEQAYRDFKNNFSYIK